MAHDTLFDIYSKNLFPEYPDNAKYFRVEPLKYRLDAHQSTTHLPAQDGRDVTPAPEIRPPPFLRVNLCDRPKYPARGWIFGSDPKACDIVIGKHSEGISRTQFSVSPARDSGRLIIQNLSRHKTLVAEKVDGEVEYVPIEEQRGISDTQSLRVAVGIQTTLKITLRGQHGDLYDKSWAELYADLNREGPTLEALTIAPPPASTRISPYILKSLIAKQPTSMLYSALERWSNRQVVIKQYSKQYLTRHPRAADREASFLSRIQHENIVALQDYSHECGLILAHFNGRLLSDEHKRAPLTYGEFKSVLRQSAEALEHLHGLALYHGAFGSESIVVRQRQPSIEVALLNFDTSSQERTRECLIGQDMKDLYRWMLKSLCGEETEPVDGCPLVRNARVDQICSAWKNAFYESIYNGTTHAAALLKELDTCSVMKDDSAGNADTLPLVTTAHSAIGSDQISLPDTEPCGDAEEAETYVYRHGQDLVSVRKLDGNYQVNLTDVLRAAHLPDAHSTALKKHRGVGHQQRTGFHESSWVSLSRGMAITESLGMSIPGPFKFSQTAGITESLGMDAGESLVRPRRRVRARRCPPSSAHSARLEVYQNSDAKHGRGRDMRAGRPRAVESGRRASSSRRAGRTTP